MRTQDSWEAGLGWGHRQEQQQPVQAEDGQAKVGGSEPPHPQSQNAGNAGVRTAAVSG